MAILGIAEEGTIQTPEETMNACNLLAGDEVELLIDLNRNAAD